MRKLIILTTLLAAVLAIPAMAATKSTTLKDDYFRKTKITVTKGTTVKWRWNTHDKHTVTELSGKWGSKGEKKKGTFKHKFTKRGKFTIYCNVHPVEMRQRITVK